MPPSVPLLELTNDEHFVRVYIHPRVVAIPSSVRVTESAMEDYERWVK